MVTRRAWLAALALLLVTSCTGAAEQEVSGPTARLPGAPGPTGPPAALPGDDASIARPGGDPEVVALRDGHLEVHFLDVGQGDATLLQTSQATILIDAGRHDRSDLTGLLKARGVSGIDVVAVTHGHADHIGQLPSVLEAFDVSEVWMSGTPHTTRTFERALAAVERSEAAYEEPRAGQRTRVGDLQIDIVHPQRLGQGLHGDTLAMRITYGAVSFLFTGDAEAPTEAQMIARDPGLLQATVYQAGHHGSSTSTSAAFLAVVSPEVAVWSAGRNNQYGHPHSQVADRLTSAGVDVYGTAEHGTVTVATDGATYSVAAGASAAGGPDITPASPRAPPPIAGGGVGCEPGQVDVNRADAPELQEIIHIGAVRAGYIVELRPFASVDDLTRVHGIGSARLADIKSQGLACVRS